MALDTRYGTVDLEKGDIGAEEPVFVLRAADNMSVTAINYYKERTIESMRENGATEEEVEAFEEETVKARNAVRDWEPES